MKTVSASAFRRFAALLIAVLLLIPALAAYPAPTAVRNAAESEDRSVPALRAESTDSDPLLSESEPYRYMLDEFLKCGVKVTDAGSTVCEVSVSKLGLTTEDVNNLFSALYYSEAELFFLSGHYSFTRYTGSDVVQSVIAVYTDQIDPADASPEKIAEFRDGVLAQIDEFRELTDAIVKQADSSFSEWEKAAFVHDYVALHCGYDNDYEIYDAYRMLKEGTGVCQAYSLLTRYLLNKLGVGCECVSCEGLNHEWNVVKIGGYWYHMDVTWDDWDDRGLYGQISHNYFLASDSYFDAGENGDRGEGSHHSDSGWDSPIRATNGSFDGVFSNVSTPFIFADDTIYVINDGDLSTYDPATETFTVLLELNLTWRVGHGLFGLGGGKWNGIYSGLWYHNGKLYWNGDKRIYSYDPVTQADPIVLYYYTGHSNLIFGFRAAAVGKDAAFTLALMSDPNNKNPVEEVQTITGYDVTWNVAGVTYKTVSLYGETPRFDGPLSIPSNLFDYAFLQWDRSPRPTKQDTTYTAMFRMTRNEETLTGKTLREQFRLLRDVERLLPCSSAGYLDADEQLAALDALLAAYNEEIQTYNAVFSRVLFGEE